MEKPKPIPEDQLQREATQAGTAYIQSKMPLPHDIVERSLALNSCAHGFFMGVRWLEKFYVESRYQTKNDIFDTEVKR